MARNYGKRPRMTCRGCGKDVAQSTTTGHERTHKCPHGKDCYGKTNPAPFDRCMQCHDAVTMNADEKRQFIKNSEGTMNKAYDRTLKAWADDKRASLDPRILDLIRGANFSLYYGPGAGGSKCDEWPGFGKACDEIRAALSDVGDVWLDTDAELWTDVEPTENIDLYCAAKRSDLLRAIVGKELVEYVR